MSINFLRYTQTQTSFDMPLLLSTAERGAGGQIAPGLHGPKGLIEPNLQGLWGLIKYTSSNFLKLISGC